MSKILGHIGELLDEYRELGRLLESQGNNEVGRNATLGGAGQGGSSTSVGAGVRGDVGTELTARQRLLQQRFETGRESFLRSYRNVAKEQPYETASYYVRQVGGWMEEERGVFGGEGGLRCARWGVFVWWCLVVMLVLR